MLFSVVVVRTISYLLLGRQNESPAKNFVGFRVKSVSDSNIQTAARFLALAIQQIDTLLQDWYPGLDTTNIFGENLVTRLIPCQKCIRRIISMGVAPSPHLRESRKARDDICNGDEHGKSSSPFRKSTFYCKTPGDDDDEVPTREMGSARDVSSTRDESPVRDTTSPSSDSGSSSGLGTDSSFVTIDPDDSSRESSPVSHNVNPEKNEYEQDTTDSDTERSGTSSQTSGVPPSPRHGSGIGERVIATFEFEECVVISHTSDHVTCPIDGDLPLKEAAPDVVSNYH
jgi:hypothetical protein